jgi:hypothetical protein
MRTLGESLSVLCVFAACADQGTGPDSVLTTGASGSASAEASGDVDGDGEAGDGDGDGEGTGTTGDGDGDEAPKFDTPVGDESGSGEGCEKVDFLFVVDNSISMGDEQQNLGNSFPNFIDTIQADVEADDYHIMVIDTDDIDKWGEKWDKCYEKCMTEDPGESCLTVWFDDLICGQLPPGPSTCDQTLGAGRNVGAGGPPIDCPVDGDLRYMTQDQTDLDGTFQCVADMGATGNSNERPMAAMLDATGVQTQPGGCHPGFLRDDAILVVTLISDEEELGSPGDPASWRADLLLRKGGNETAVVVLALSGDANTPGQECTPTSRVSQFVDSFGARGFIGSVCEPDYGPFFQDAVDVIDYACENFVPEG